MIHSWDNKPLRDLEDFIDLCEQSLIQCDRCVFCHEQLGDWGVVSHKETCQITKARDILIRLECGDD